MKAKVGITRNEKVDGSIPSGGSTYSSAVGDATGLGIAPRQPWRGCSRWSQQSAADIRLSKPRLLKTIMQTSDEQ